MGRVSGGEREHTGGEGEMELLSRDDAERAGE